MSDEAIKPSKGKRKVRIMLRQMGVWLDAWCLRGYTQDSSAWETKLHHLRSLKRTGREVR